jgi:RNA polymerase sigma factor (sigma-70 family)
MPSGDSVSDWIEGLRAGEETAATNLWGHFYTRLVALVCRRLGDLPRRAADEEDVVVSAFETFFRRAQEGQFPRLHDRNDLWQLLVTITERKALNLLRDQKRQKRGGGMVRGDSAFSSSTGSTDGHGIDEVVGPEPTPEFAAIMTEELQRLLGSLDNDLRQIALMKLEGRTNEEIASLVDRSVPTVERRLKLIRNVWRQKTV